MRWARSVGPKYASTRPVVPAEPQTELEVGLSALTARREYGLPFADADAERRQAVAAFAAPQLVQEGDHEARAAHPERMADRDRRRRH